MKFPKSSLFLLCLAMVLALAVACGGGAEPAASPDASGGTAGDAGAGAEAGAGTEAGGETETAAGDKIDIILVENAWSASELNVAVAKILIEEELGHTVEVVSLDENAQWAALAAGDAHASLEVWPSGHASNVEQYIDQLGTVENGGLLGPVGKIGWYIPSYLVEQNPALASWEAYESAETGALFATAETGELGQFLGGDPSFVQYDADIINNLGMPFEVVYAGSEEAILAQLDAAYSREAPILFYLWTPHAIHAKYALTQVALPAYSDECYAAADTGGVDCDYPADNLFKIFWSGLAAAAPDVHTFLSKMNYSTEDQIAMMAAVELDGQSVEESAQAWIDGHEDVWRAWLP